MFLARLTSSFRREPESSADPIREMGYGFQPNGQAGKPEVRGDESVRQPFQADLARNQCGITEVL